MVEKIVQDEKEGAAETGCGWFKLPKNIKQMGLGGNSPEIYIEDYAEGFLRRLAGNDYTECRVAVLVGEFVKSEGKRYVFIRGAVEAEGAMVDNTVRFTSEVWAGVYERMKRYFPQYEAVGWFLGGPEFLTEVTEEVRQIHVDWFGGRDRVLYRIDPVEKEATFYLYDKGELRQWPGYCIYYEKNEEMQDYLVAGAPPSVDAGYTEPVLAEISRRVGRTEDAEPKGDEVLQSSGEQKEMKRQEIRQVKTGSGHGAGIAAAIALLAIGAFALKKNELGLMQNTGGDAISSPTAEVIAENYMPEQSIWVNAGVEPELSAGVREEEGKSMFYDDFIPVTEAPLDYEEEGKKDEDRKVTEKTEELPKPTEVADPENEVGASEVLNLYIVQKGDTLAGICKDFYGDTLRMEEIKGINQIVDENWIYAGQELYLP